MLLQACRLLQEATVTPLVTTMQVLPNLPRNPCSMIQAGRLWSLPMIQP